MLLGHVPNKALLTPGSCGNSISSEVKNKYHNNYYLHAICLQLLLSGDIYVNPGLVENPCGACQKPVRKHQLAILCNDCCYWYHIKCIDMPIFEYNNLSNSGEDWYCRTCTLPNFSDSYFDHNKSFDGTSDHEISYTGSLSNINLNIDTRELIQDNEDLRRPNGANNIFDDLIQVRKKHPNKFISSYLNINSLRYKFCSIKGLLSRNIVDMLIIAETKLDESFPDTQFRVNNYHLWINDRNKHGGGLAIYLRSDVTSHRKKNLECNKIEPICVELYVKSKRC